MPPTDATCATCIPATISTVDPRSGPDHGDTECTEATSTSNCTPPDVNSRPFVLASMTTTPAAHRRGDTNTSADSPTYEAALTNVVQEQHSRTDGLPTIEAIAGSTRMKPRPNSVTGVPPSDAPRDGHTDDTAAAAWYVKRALAEDKNCCPLSDTSTDRALTPTDGGDAHSS